MLTIEKWKHGAFLVKSKVLTIAIALLTSALLLYFQVEQNRVKLLNDQAVAKSQLQKKLGQFLYLTNLEKVIYITKTTKHIYNSAGHSGPSLRVLITLQLTKLSFLQSQDKSTGGLNPEPCPICARPLGQEVSIALLSYHTNCRTNYIPGLDI